LYVSEHGVREATLTKIKLSYPRGECMVYSHSLLKCKKSIEATDMEYLFLATVPTWSICIKATDMEYKSSEPTHVEYLFLATVPTWSICGKATDMEYKSSEPTDVEYL
jgi:hypothetical protein